MAFAFDTLGYAKRLRDAGVPEPEAEAHAEAAREFIMAELATRYDLEVLRRELEHRVESSAQRLESRIDSLELRLMVRLGGLIAIGVAILAAIIKF